jgi:hypothetical protein
LGFYNDFILPRLCDLAMRNQQLLPFRQRVIGAAKGRVLEIGVGTSHAANSRDRGLRGGTTSGTMSCSATPMRSIGVASAATRVTS